jgi:hypothetical protein
MDAPLFHTALVTDSKISQITDDLAFAVYQGASSNTYQQFTAVSNSNSNLTFNVQIPSESVVINREVLIRSLMTITLTIGQVPSPNPSGYTAVPAGVLAFNYGQTDAFQAFPMSKAFQTTTATINNSNVSTNTQDIIDVLLRMNSSRELLRYSGMTPSFPDSQYAQYVDGYLANNNPLASYNNSSYDIDQVPRGSYPLSNTPTSNPAGIVSQIYRYTTAGGSAPVDNSPVATGVAGEYWNVVLQIDVTEPIFCSPFIFGKPDFNQSGLAGINTINLVMNIDGTLKRVFSTMAGSQVVGGNWNYSIAGGDTTGNNPLYSTLFSSPTLLMNFLSTQPTQLVPSRVVTPYIDYPRYISSSFSNASIPAFPSSSSTTTIQSQNIQLNQLPDYFFIVVRPQMANQTIKQSASFLTINNISINLNNVSGILASATQEDLWKMSIDNHSTQSWLEFSGQASNNSNTTGLGDLVGTTGSILVLSPALNLSLSNMLSNSSIGQFNFQFNIGVTNNLGETVTAEVLVITANSGMFVTSMGSSSIFTGLLTKQLVLDASEKQSENPIQSSMISRLVGGKMGNMPSSAMKHLIGKDGMRRMSMTAGAEGHGRVGVSKLGRLCM